MQQFAHQRQANLIFFQKILTAFLFVCCMAVTNNLCATTYAPNRFDDPAFTSVNNTTGVITAGTGVGTISLRSAIKAADNNGFGPHIITLVAGTYDLSSGAIPFGSFVQNITINGVAVLPLTTIINMVANATQDRIFFINYPFATTAGVQTTINYIKFTNGHLNTDPYGGGAIRAGGPNNILNLKNCIFDNNTLDVLNGGTTGGAINISGGGAVNIDSCTFNNNSNPVSDGGAVYYFFANNAGLTGSLSITNSLFTNNTATAAGPGNGGAIGIATQGSLGGRTFSATIQKNTFTGNTAPGADGGAFIINNGDAGYVININYNRIVGNSALNTKHSALGMYNASGSVIATNNWWGCNTDPKTAGACNRADTVGSGGTGVLTTTPWIVLKDTTSKDSICPTTSATITASFLKNSAGSTLTVANISTLIGLPVSFGSPVLGSLSSAQSTIQANGTATVTYTAGSTPGVGSVNAVVDNVPSTDVIAKAIVVIKGPGSWIGTTNSSWLNAANWECGILPTATTDVVIKAGAPNMPVVDAAGAICNGLTIASGASLSFSGNNLLEVRGTLTLNGTFTPTNGSLRLNSASAQILPAGNYYDLFIEGGGNKTPNGAVTVSHTLALTSGLIILSANDLTINSTGTISGGSLTAFIQITGNGRIFQNGIGTTGRTGGILFPVGTSTASGYTPVTLNNTGTIDNFSVRVIDNVYKTYAGETGSIIQSTNVVGKTWFINEAVAGGSNAAITFQWNLANEVSGFTRASSYVSHYESSGNYWQKFTTQAASGANPYLITQNNITVFSPFGVASGNSVLPLQLISFTGRLSGSKIYLDWKTSNESGLNKYVIERNNDNNPFVAIGEKQAANTFAESIYNFEDASIETLKWHTAQYRLKIIDQSGVVSYSNIISFTNGNKKMYVSIINPFSSQLKISVDAVDKEQAAIVLTDISGKQFIKKNVDLNTGANSIILNTSSFASGNYILKIITDKNTITQKVVKVE